MSSISKSVGKGIFYTAVARYSNIVISLIITAILARLLTPEEYGIIAIVVVFITFFQYLADFGIGPAIIQNKELTKKDVETIFTITLFIGLGFAILFYLCSNLIANFYGDPELVNISKLFSISVLLFTLNVVPSSQNRKELKFKQISIIAIVVQIVSGIIAVILALLDFSYYALVYRSLINGLFLLIGNYYLNPVKLTYHINFSALRKIWRFSTFQFLFNFINYFSRHTDNLLIGKFLSPAKLGFYDKAYNLMLMPTQNLTFVITPVLHPILSEFQNSKVRIFESYLTLIRILSLIGFPLSVVLFFSGKELIYLLYGSQWTESIPVFQYLAVIVGFEILMTSSGSIFQSLNRTDLLFTSGFIASSTIVLGVLYGIFIEKSLIGVGKGLLVSGLINFFQSFYFLIRRALGYPMGRFFKELLNPLLISLAVLVANLLFMQIDFENMYLGFVLKLIISSVVFLLVFIPSERNRQLTAKFYLQFKTRNQN